MSITHLREQLQAKIKLGKLEVLELGNMDAKRDWGFAKEYVEGMWRMLQADKPYTYVLATNRTETVRDFVTMTFKAVDVTLGWSGSGDNEVAHCTVSGKQFVRVSPKFYRPAEVELLIGDPANYTAPYHDLIARRATGSSAAALEQTGAGLSQTKV